MDNIEQIISNEIGPRGTPARELFEEEIENDYARYIKIKEMYNKGIINEEVSIYIEAVRVIKGVLG